MENQAPRFTILAKLNPDSDFTAKQFKNLEGTILSSMNWNIFIPSPTHYVDILRAYIIDLDNDLVAGNPISERDREEMGKRVMEFVDYFLDVSMQVSNY